MSGPAYFKQPTIQRLPSLLEEIHTGQLLIPRFQRPFVWKDQQRLDLLDSVYRGMPIGSILVWRAQKHTLRCYDHLGPLPIATSPPRESEVKQYLLDGHQRLTTLYVALSRREENGDLVDPDAGDSENKWPIYFDLSTERLELRPRRGPVPQTWVPLSIVFEPYLLFEFQKKLFDLPQGKILAKRAESLASTFKDYSIAVVPIATEDLEAVTTSFQRINSAGTKMSQVHMVSALTWRTDFDLNERMEEIRHDALADVGWEDLDEQMILNTCKAALDLDIYDSTPEDLKKRLDGNHSVLDEVTRRLICAASFLREECGVNGPATLPYRLQIVLLAHVLPPTLSELDDVSRSWLRDWFWITTYTEYFGTSMNPPRLANELRRLKQASYRQEPPAPPDAVETVEPIARFDFRAARARAMALQMARLSPRMHDGTPIDASQLLADLGTRATPMLLRPHELLASRTGHGPENRVIMTPQSVSTLRNYLAPPPTQPSLFPRDPDVLASHAISSEAADAFAKRDYALFLTLRREYLLYLEQSFIEALGLAYDRAGTSWDSDLFW